MKPSTHFKFLSTIPTAVLLLGALALLPSCYDASQNPRGNRGAGGGGPVKASPKPIGLVILDVIQMSADALKKPSCSFVPLSLAELREAEAQVRIKGMTEVLAGLADTVRIYRTEISATDCTKLNAIEARALKANPAETSGIATATRAKPAVHVRMVIWNGDRSYDYPPWSVTYYNWDSFNELVKQKFGTPLSVTHFAATARSSGYVANWFSYASRSENTFVATTIENPSADSGGLTALTEAAAKSSEDFGNWLTQRIESGPSTARADRK